MRDFSLLSSRMWLDMLVSMVHHHERGIPQYLRATMIGSHWMPGSTVKQQN